MAVGHYKPDLYESAIVPWTTLGPLMVVIAFSLMVEGSADLKRHANDRETNDIATCIVLTRREDLPENHRDSPHIVTPNLSKRDDNHHNDPSGSGHRATEILQGNDVPVTLHRPLDSHHSVNSSVIQTVVPPIMDEENNNENPPVTSDKAHIAFLRIRRADVRQGHIVVVKNREMVPADIVLLASSSDGGSAYIETSSIDGETNLKLRSIPHVPRSVERAMRSVQSDKSPANQPLSSIEEEKTENHSRTNYDEDDVVRSETIEEAVQRITRFSYLGHPDAESVLMHPIYKQTHDIDNEEEEPGSQRFSSPLLNNLENSLRGFIANVGEVTHQLQHPHHLYQTLSRRDSRDVNDHDHDDYIAALVTEPPNPSVHTFQGKFVLPPLGQTDRNRQPQELMELPLDATNVLLRGAVLRNTEWIIGVAFFTGKDTKLVQNSVKTRSKFSQLDRLMNQTVLVILAVMISVISYLATMAVRSNQEKFDDLWYAGFNTNGSEPWPFLPNLDAPKWKTTPRTWIQFFFLYVTLLTNFIPLSLYISVEFVTFCMMTFVHNDLEMYDDTSNTRAIARSTNITDLGRVQYIFSDKTGTLTQNVMRFKRCSVDGSAFGAPIQKATPEINKEMPNEEAENSDNPRASPSLNESTPFHPLRQLLVGRLHRPSVNVVLPTSGNRAPNKVRTIEIASDRLTFNAEMFLRVMSLCHTVVVEKDLDHKYGRIGASERSGIEDVQQYSSGAETFSKRSRFGRHYQTTLGRSGLKKSTIRPEEESILLGDDDSGSYHDATLVSGGSSDILEQQKSTSDGAPSGFAYQVESPDEGALVSAASSIYGFQVVVRNSQGITLRVARPSHLEDKELVAGLTNGEISLPMLAAETAFDLSLQPSATVDATWSSEREETWTILATNTFDSDRKRMSVLLRSPPELGNLPVLFCKGADTSMLDPSVCAHTKAILQQTNSEPKMDLDDFPEEIDPYEEWEIAHMLSLRAHLGDFASEGLRTLVLGIRILNEAECREWLDVYKAASVSLVNRSGLLAEAALAIETNLHIVGATAIEDRLQRGVPDTIATLGKAGIKLWVLTGDKRETAVEIGYSTNVLTPKMHVTEVEDFGELHVRTQIGMEFLSLVKRGRLSEYQQAQVSEGRTWSLRTMLYGAQFAIGKLIRRIQRCMEGWLAVVLQRLSLKELAEWHLARVNRNLDDEAHIINVLQRRRNVRRRAEAIVRAWLESDEGRIQRRGGDCDDDELSMVSDDTPKVFRNATAAKSLLMDIRESGRLSHATLREISLASLTALQAGQRGTWPLVDEDTLSMESFCPGNMDDSGHYFDTKRRTLLERAFAIDKAMQKGRLRKHVFPEKLIALDGNEASIGVKTPNTSALGAGPRALVIDGDALKHLLGDPEIEELLFSVARTCDAVIACRVSPKQKALLVNLVRHNVFPKPVTLAIGDGANDVGMIQEADVGVGISGKEGQQAVNASDFAIAQFRFLKELVLIHGRWDFFRLSTVVLFSFYKNAVLAGALVTFASQTVYSGTSLFDQWLIAMLNFVAGIPIIMTGLFDRCLSRDYVKRNPEVYRATQENELITSRTLLRWICMVFIHLFTLYYFTIPTQSNGGGMTSAFTGLMRNEAFDEPGNGEGGDLKSAGTVTFSCMIFLLAYKVLYESRSLIHGVWPAFTFRKGSGEGLWSRLAYTWVGVTFLSIGFYFWAINNYQMMGRIFVSNLSSFVDVMNHVLCTRSLSWMLIVFVPIIGVTFDVCLKLFSNMFYPTQTQIHREIEAKELGERRKRKLVQ